MSEFVLPVWHLDSIGMTTADHINAAPCVEAIYTFKTLMPVDVVTEEARAWALIDTGSAATYIDPELLPCHARPYRDVMVSGAVGTDVSLGYYPLQLRLVGAPVSLDVEVIPLQYGQSKPYRIILGRSFLSHCQFTYDGAVGIRTLTFRPHL